MSGSPVNMLSGRAAEGTVTAADQSIVFIPVLLEPEPFCLAITRPRGALLVAIFFLLNYKERAYS
jgi:hypothetical protein